MVSNQDIVKGAGCRKCKGMHVRPAQLSRIEKLFELLRWPQLLIQTRLHKDETWMAKQKEVKHGEAKA